MGKAQRQKPTSVVELEPGLSRRDCGQDGKSVNSRLDVGSRSVLVRQHGLGIRDGGLGQTMQSIDKLREHVSKEPKRNSPQAS